MAEYPRRSAEPWRRSIDESTPRDRRNAAREITLCEKLVAAVIIALILAMAIWFFFIAKGGPGPGTV